MDTLLAHYNHVISVFVMMTGLYVVIGRMNLIKKIVGLNLFQNAVFIFYISLGKVSGGVPPIIAPDYTGAYSNPLPHVLILTAIVVGVATMAVGLALAVRIREAYGTIEENEIIALERRDNNDDA